MTDILQHIVITGASSGLGEALARHYAHAGAERLSLTGRNQDRLEAVAAACREHGAHVVDACVDVTDGAAMRAWLLAQDGDMAVDLVIANAGISAGTFGPKGESEEQVRQIFDVNVNGVLNTLHPLLPKMQARGRGHIAIMSSLAGYRAWPSAPAYGASKAAVKAYGEALGGSLHGSGVLVSVVCPGFVRSRMTDVNDFPMPFLMDTGRAAQIIVRGLARGKARIAFPWPMIFMIILLLHLPYKLVRFLSQNNPGKAPLQG